MSSRARVTEILSKAKERERSYDWLGALRLYKTASNMVQRETLRAGRIYELIGYSSFRAAFQADIVQEFKKLMQKSIEAYEKAASLFERTALSRNLYCKAMARYSGFWFADNPLNRRGFLDNCRSLLKEALQCYDGSNDDMGYCEAVRSLLTCLKARKGFAEDWHELRQIAEEAIGYGQNAMAKLSGVEDINESAWVYALTASFIDTNLDLFEEKKKQFLSMSSDYSKRISGLLEDIEDAYLLSFMYDALLVNAFAVKGDHQAGTSYCEKQLRQGRTLNDHFLIGAACRVMNVIIADEANAEEDPDKQKEKHELAIRYAEESIRNSLLVCDYNNVSWTYANYLIDSYTKLAQLEIGLEEKRILLKRAIEVGRNGVEYAELSGCQTAMQYVFHVLSKAFFFLSGTEAITSQKKKLLEEALELRKRSIKISEKQFSADDWVLGVFQNYLALIKADLANMEEDVTRKRHLLEEAVLGMERCVEICTEYLQRQIAPRPTSFASVGWYYDWFGEILGRLYLLTKDGKALDRAIDIYRGAAQAYQRAGMLSRVAEAYWKAAKLSDQCGEHSKAAEDFEQACRNYQLAAEKIPHLKGFYSDYASYMSAWVEIEKSRYEREKEDYAESREHYRACSRLLEMTKNWSYLSPYYFAWSLLDHGENLSRLDKPQDAIKVFNEAGRTFGDSANSLPKKVEQLENPEERDEASKLANIAGLRRQYCIGRVLMEEATLSDRKGERIASANKYASAAGIFKEIAPNLEREEAREDLQFAAAVCEAWEKMELAEERGDAALYKKAADLFAKASEISRRKTAKSTAMGNSCFCEALEMGMKFMATSNTDFYSGAKLRMESAAGYYQRAGFEKPALWVEATKRLFDAYVYVGKAEAETESEKRVKFYLMAEKCLELSAKFYGKAGHRGKKNEVLQNLERVSKERQLAFSLNEVLTAPAVLSSTTRVSMPDLTEKATGLKGFESVNIRASVSVPKEFIPGEEFEVKLDLANVGTKPGLLVRIEGLVPLRCEVLRVPSYCALEGASLNMRGRKLDPLSVKSVSIWVHIADVAGVSLFPLVVYVDELGNFKTARAEEVKILPVVKFESKVAQVVFNYLVDAFVEDCVKLRLGVEKSGWRSFPQIIKEAGVSKRSLYGAGGRIGHGLSELQRIGLVDLETLIGERGRGGHILRVRIHHERELVKRYVREKAPNLLA